MTTVNVFCQCCLSYISHNKVRLNLKNNIKQKLKKYNIIYYSLHCRPFYELGHYKNKLFFIFNINNWFTHWHFLLTLYCADCPKPPNSLCAQTVQNHPVNSQFVGLSFTAIRSDLDIKLLYPLAWGGACRFEKLLAPQKVTGPNIVKKICCYWGAHRFSRSSFNRSDIMKTFWSSYVACFLNVNFSDCNNKKRKLDVKWNLLVVVLVC